MHGATPSPNIWHHPATYEIENHAADPHGRIEAAMAQVREWYDARFLDNQYTVWGEVTEGMENVDALPKGEPPANPGKIVKASVA